MTIGVLALQGGYQAHVETLHACGISDVLLVRDAATLQKCDGLVIPGGESTTMSRLCDRYDLWPALQEWHAQGGGFFGTCAGLIFLAKNITGATQNFTQKTLGVLDVDVARNAYGAQNESFETALEATSALGDEPLSAIFIRAPRITRVGGDVEVLAQRDDEAVAVRRGNVMALAWHPEIAGEKRLHQLWLRDLQERRL
ncbi:MAG TPA: pyridoxal 5'-phosphate synthase glutaminase subunit PdxT [Abditibacteriaceae bacterium]|jgi:5'-phosphate synthase pdxT subunit